MDEQCVKKLAGNTGTRPWAYDRRRFAEPVPTCKALHRGVR